MGLSWTELLIVGIVALIVIGPKELPAMMNRLGKMAATVRRLGQDFQREINKTTNLNEVKNLRDSIANPLKATADTIRKEFNTTTSTGTVVPSGVLKPADPSAESVVAEIRQAAGIVEPKPAEAPAAASGAAVEAPAPVIAAATTAAVAAAAPAKTGPVSVQTAPAALADTPVAADSVTPVRAKRIKLAEQVTPPADTAASAETPAKPVRKRTKKSETAGEDVIVSDPVAKKTRSAAKKPVTE